MQKKDILKTRHKFQSFSRIIASISPDISNAYELRIAQPSAGEMGSFFYEQLLESLRSCLDPSYAVLARKILPISKSLPILLYNKEQLFGFLFEFLDQPYSIIKGGFEDFLKLLPPLARDLREEFYPYFQKLLLGLVNVFEPSSEGVIRAFFDAICFLFRFLQKPLVEDIHNVLNAYVECFFNHKLDFARRLGSESLAFLLRQAPGKMAVHGHLLEATRVFLEGKEPEDVEHIVESLGVCLYQEIKNASGALRSNSVRFLKAFLQVRDEFVFNAFLICQQKAAKHSEREYTHVVDYLAESLPGIDATLAGRIFNVWMSEREGKLIVNHSQLYDVLGQCFNGMENEVLCQYLVNLSLFDIPEEMGELISQCMLKLVSDERRLKFLLELDSCRTVAMLSSKALIESFVGDESKLGYLVNVLQWIQPNSNQPELVEFLNASLTRYRTNVIDCLQIVHNRQSYTLLAGLKDLSMHEKQVYFTLMAHYEKDKIPNQLPLVIDSIGDQLMTKEGLTMVLHLANVSYQFHPDWLNDKSELFMKLLNLLDFNNDNEELRGLAADIMSVFVNMDVGIHAFNDEALLARAATICFKITHSAVWMKSCEVAVDRLTSSVEFIRNTEKLFNIAMGIAKQRFLYARQHGVELVKKLIEFRPEIYGKAVTEELERRFPYTDCPNYAETLLEALGKVHFVDQTIVTLVEKYCAIDANTIDNEDEVEEKNEKMAVLFLQAVSSVQPGDEFADRIENAGIVMLRSVTQNVRNAAFELIFRYRVLTDPRIDEQKREKIHQLLSAYVKADGRSDDLMKFEEFSNENIEFRPLLSLVAVNLTVGILFEYLTVKKSMKNKFRQLARTVLQSIAFLSPNEMEPLFDAVIVKNPTPAFLRKFPRFLMPLISRIPEHLHGRLGDIVALLMKGMESCCRKEGSREMKSTCNATTAFLNCYDGFPELSETCLVSLERLLVRPLAATVHLVDAVADHDPQAFSGHPEVVNRIIKLMQQKPPECIGDLFVIVGKITAYVPFAHAEIIQTLSDLLGDSKLFRRDVVSTSFVKFMSIMKDKFISPEFQELSVRFLVLYQNIDAIPIVNGMKLTDDQFNALCTMIAYPLQPEFRVQLVPLIAESLGDYSKPFIILNTEDPTTKAQTYGQLESAGDFAFVFALQAFADVQLNDFSLRSASVGFLSRVIATSPDVVGDFILPSIEFHLGKRHSRVPPNEILIMLQAITKTLPDLLPSISVLSTQSFFLMLGSVDVGARSVAMEQLSAFVAERDDWAERDMSTILMPLLCQLATTPGVDVALTHVCTYCPENILERMAKNLCHELKHGNIASLIVALCKAHALPADAVKDHLLKAIDNKKLGRRIHLQLIVALLAVDNSAEVIRHLTSVVVHQMMAKKDDVRELAQHSLTALVESMDSSNYFVLFQDLRNNMKHGYQIPLMYVAFNNIITHAKEQGVFDSFISLLAEALLDDIFGENALLRRQFSTHVKEAKKCYSFDSLEKLAANVDFTATSRELINAVLVCFDKLRTLEQARGAKRLIMMMTSGFANNLSVNPQVLCDVVNDLLKQSAEKQKIAEKDQTNEERVQYGMKYHSDLLFEKPKRDASEEGNQIVQRLGSYFLVSLYAMRLLAVFLDQDLFDTEDERQVKLLEDLFPSVWKFTTQTQDTETLVVAISIISHYITFKIFMTYMPDILSFLTDAISKMSKVSDDYGKAVFGLLTEILQRFPTLQLPDKFTRVLVMFCNSQLDVHDSCGAVFGVLHLIMDRRKDVPEIYDVARNGFELMIRAQSEQVRTNCAILCANFLTTYEVREREFEDHLKFVLTNLQSPKAVARRTLLKFMKLLINQVQSERLEKYAELMFAYFGARVANESDEGITKKLRKDVGLLLLKVSDSKFASLWKLMAIWASANGNQVRTGLLLLSIAVSYCSEAMANLVDQLQQIVDLRITSENAKVRICAVDLHKQIISAYSGSESVKLLSAEMIEGLIKERETCRLGCEILFWYLTTFPSFEPDEGACLALGKECLNVIVSWRGTVKEAGDSLHNLLCRLPDMACASFLADSLRTCTSEEQPAETMLVIMRVLVATILERETNEAILRNVLTFVIHVERNEDTKGAATKALEVLRHNVPAEIFTQEWTAITAEEEERKRAEELERQKQAELDPEGFKQRLAEERRQKKIEERRKKYLTAGDEYGVLHSYGQDGKEVERIPLTREFRD